MSERIDKFVAKLHQMTINPWTSRPAYSKAVVEAISVIKGLQSELDTVCTLYHHTLPISVRESKHHE